MDHYFRKPIVIGPHKIVGLAQWPDGTWYPLDSYGRAWDWSQWKAALRQY